MLTWCFNKRIINPFKLFLFEDVIDEFMIKTGTRRESIFYSFYVFFTKISSGIAIAITSVILEYLIIFSSHFMD